MIYLSILGVKKNKLLNIETDRETQRQTDRQRQRQRLGDGGGEIE